MMPIFPVKTMEFFDIAPLKIDGILMYSESSERVPTLHYIDGLAESIIYCGSLLSKK